jgi:hypothetical protein
MDTVKVNLAAMNEKLERVREQMDRKQENVKTKVVAKVKLVQEQLRGQLNKQEESISQLKADNVEIKRSLNGITIQLERMIQQTSHKVQAKEMKKDIAEGGMNREPKVLIAGGFNDKGYLNSVEVFMFSLLNATWTPQKPMKESRERASSAVHNNAIIVMGGYGKHSGMNSIEKLSLNAVQVDQSITWENVLAKLPAPLDGHCSVVYNGRLIVIGGFNGNQGTYSDSITEISFVLPYTSKLLSTMPQARYLHGVALFGDKILILGGRSSVLCCSTNLASVLLYDITKNECKELAALPYPASEMATVKWSDDSVIIVGGVDSNDQPLNKVLLYNIKTQKICMLPDMEYKRRGCVAAVVRDTVIVMGGIDQRRKCLKSAECFRFDRYSWQELPEMQQARYLATAVVC